MKHVELAQATLFEGSACMFYAALLCVAYTAGTLF